MTKIESLPPTFQNLADALQTMEPSEAIPDLEHLHAPEGDSIGELLQGATTPAMRRERILGAIMGVLEEGGIPSGLAATAVEQLLSTDPARRNVVRQRIRGGLETLKQAATKKRDEREKLP